MNDSAIPKAEAVKIYRAGLLTAIKQVRQMTNYYLPEGLRSRMDAWDERVRSWAHGECRVGFEPPDSFRSVKAIGDQGVPGPSNPLHTHPGRPDVADLYGEHMAQRRGPEPPTWAGQDDKPMAGRTYLQSLRDRGIHVEDSERR